LIWQRASVTILMMIPMTIPTMILMTSRTPKDWMLTGAGGRKSASLTPGTVPMMYTEPRK
jgi:hypothetical protein